MFELGKGLKEKRTLEFMSMRFLLRKLGSTNEKI
tara:strand:+ start:379 stop:480 length:102 start_codon:yes stop_codon:yes gene_type:complete